jgi:hypothetical protein
MILSEEPVYWNTREEVHSMHVEKAIAYVRKNGNPLHQLRLCCILGESFSLTEAEEV